MPKPVIPIRDARLMRHTKVVFADIGAFRWARRAVRYVAGIHDYMADVRPKPDGELRFHPRQFESRIRFAKAVVLAFAPDDPVDPTITFADLHPSDPLYRFANVTVKRGWLRTRANGRFDVSGAVRMVDVHRALVLALGLQPAADALDALHTTRGHTFDTPRDFGTTLLGMRLHLRYNNWTDEALDVGPLTPLNRAQVAYSLFRALTEPPRAVPRLLKEYSTITLPALTPQVTRLVEWGIRFVGYPYVWGGEWGKAAPEPQTLGGQPIPGFDCSGFTWWLLRENNPSDGWRVAPPRPYHGWSLPQRTSREMGAIGNLWWAQLRPGDIALYREEGRIGHVDVYIGNGFALDSSSSPAGVTIMWIGGGWYRGHFVHGRRIIAA